ncbi:MAG: hypothetical protein M1837_003751 [Sclerophora amabilis]|nr:MAG: hypothetical protein M1837_003751 [Sclerophora amabilis]
MSSANRRPPPASSPVNRQNDAPASSPRSNPRSSTPSNTTTGPARARSVRGGTGGAPVSARAAAKRPGPGTPSGSSLSVNQNASNPPSDLEQEDARVETAMLIDDLKTRLENAEKISEEYQRQAQMLQARLDDALGEQGKLEERAHENDEKLEGLENEQRETSRHLKEMERIYEEERVSMNQEKEQMANREEELHSVVQRLKETLAQRESRLNSDDDVRLSRSSHNASPNHDNGQFAPPPGPSRSSSGNNANILLQKDRVIESLRLELAEAQIKVVDAENSGGGRVQVLERQLLDTRMTNARLMEDNESFQLLLSEKTLNGDFSKADFMQIPSSSADLDDATGPKGTLSSSLADELESAAEGESDKYRRLEAEAKSLKDQNKALTLYINNIIERLLQHKDFESILDKTPDLLAGPTARSARQEKVNVDKQLPSPPPSEASGQSILQRARSVATGANRPRPRPMSHMPPPTNRNVSSGKEDTSTQSHFPLARSQSVRASGHRRSNSDWAPATVVNQMYRGPPADQISPGISTPRRTSFFPPSLQGSNPAPPTRVASSGSQPQVPMERIGSTNSTVSARSSADLETSSVPSPPQSVAGTSSASAAIAGNKLRPLRLVVENAEEAEAADAAAKKAKRTTWMGWFNKGKPEDGMPADGLRENR